MSTIASQQPTHFPSILNLRRERRGSKVAVFDVALSSGLIICDAMLHEHVSGKRWIAWPGAEYVKNDGSKGFRSLIKFRDENVKRRLAQIVMERVRLALLEA